MGEKQKSSERASLAAGRSDPTLNRLCSFFRALGVGDVSISTTALRDNLRLDDLVTLSQITLHYSRLKYWQLDHAEKAGCVEAIRLKEGGCRLLVRSSVELFVKLRAQKKKARHADTPSRVGWPRKAHAAKEVP